MGTQIQEKREARGRTERHAPEREGLGQYWQTVVNVATHHPTGRRELAHRESSRSSGSRSPPRRRTAGGEYDGTETSHNTIQIVGERPGAARVGDQHPEILRRTPSRRSASRTESTNCRSDRPLASAEAGHDLLHGGQLQRQSGMERRDKIRAHRRVRPPGTGQRRSPPARLRRPGHSVRDRMPAPGGNPSTADGPGDGPDHADLRGKGIRPREHDHAQNLLRSTGSGSSNSEREGCWELDEEPRPGVTGEDDAGPERRVVARSATPSWLLATAGSADSLK